MIPYPLLYFISPFPFIISSLCPRLGKNSLLLMRMRMIVVINLYVSLTGLRNVQVAGKTLLLGVVCEAVSAGN